MKAGIIFSLIVSLSVTFALNFLAVGDWGGMENEPYYSPGQAATAKGMNTIASQLNAQFVLAVGDNVYRHGAVDEFDTRFRDSYESVYDGSALQKPWYAVFGNHDYNGNTTAQLEYVKHSSRWQFPSPFYKNSFTSDDGATIDFIMIDTVELASMTEKEIGQEGYFDPLPLFGKERATDQWSWIESEISSSTADYILVVGHYPVYSACSHGNTDTLIEHLLPLLKQYNAHYLSGHDHCMEHIVEPGVSVNHFLSGMGVECCYPLTNQRNVPKKSLRWYKALENKDGASGGFTSFEVNKQSMNVNYYDQDGAVLYTAPTVAPRKQ